jgi:RHS repeat-associated protein
VQERPSTPVPYLFSAKEFDPETGLYDFGARYLNPRFAQWMTTDPALGDYLPEGTQAVASQPPSLGNGWRSHPNLPGMVGAFNPQNMAPYGYAHNSPATMGDPNGRVAVCAVPPITFGCVEIAKWAAIAVLGGVAIFIPGDTPTNDTISEMASAKDIMRRAREGWEAYLERQRLGPGGNRPPPDTGTLLLMIAACYSLPNTPQIPGPPTLPRYDEKVGAVGVLRINGTDYTAEHWVWRPLFNVADHGKPGMNWNIRSHVGAHAAAMMQRTGAREATLYINRDPCTTANAMGCRDMLSRMLPPSRLTVVSPSGTTPYVGIRP